MSIVSYERNVGRHVTGPFLPTCFPAALEQISPDHSYKPGIYQNYSEFNEWWGKIRRRERIHHMPEYADGLVEPLGGYSYEDMVFSRATTPMGLARVVRRLLSEDYRVTVDIKYAISGAYNAHTVGLLPTGYEGHVSLVSTHVPKCLSGIVTLEQIGERLAISAFPHRPEYPFSDANVLALPSAD
jgi:hypothetical protein